MLVLNRRCNETIVIDGRIHIKVISTSGGRVKVGVCAPQSVSIRRSEQLDGTASVGIPLDRKPVLVSEPEAAVR